MTKIFIFGATGSIGQQALEVIKSSDDLVLVGFSYFHNNTLADAIAKDFQISHYIQFSNPTNTHWMDLLIELQPDLVLNSISGAAGLAVTRYCLKNHIALALANKESIVMGGALINFSENQIYPVDSEHSSLYELYKNDGKDIKTIYLTASGGPFYHLTNEQKYNKTFLETIQHPVWDMGNKISVDSATLVNKCFELIEAHYMYPDVNIKAIYHPTSVVHAMVEYKNNAIINYMSIPDMKIPIALALHQFKHKICLPHSELNLNNLNLYFETIDIIKHLPLQWANKVILEHKHSVGTILCVVDDYVINLFAQKKLTYGQMLDTLNKYVIKYENYPIKDWEDIDNLIQLLLQELDNEFNN